MNIQKECEANTGLVENCMFSEGFCIELNLPGIFIENLQFIPALIEVLAGMNDSTNQLQEVELPLYQGYSSVTTLQIE